ncbi:hypothetical protein L6R52_00490, partial [Myxococcota bacterium]|nr:hypothetical protein [Myxococcota bacterium]
MRLASSTSLALVLCAEVAAAADPVPRDSVVQKPVITARGRDRSEITVDAFGRWAIFAKSKTGVALQLVDKISGPGATSGRPGSTDGRIDQFLDRGNYLVLTEGDEGAKGEAKLELRGFRELNSSNGKVPQLVELKPIDATLGDFEQRSYWLDLPTARSVVIEAAGRDLADLRIWKDGTWLVDVEPSLSETTPRVGRPLGVARLFATLDAGLYLVTAYGGPPRAWAEDDGTHPFHLRFGVPKMPSALRRRGVVGPLGYDRYFVSGADYFRLELAEARAASVEVKSVGSESTNPFVAGTVGVGSIQKNTNPPVATVSASAYGSNDLKMVTISGTAGQPYVMQWFRAERWRQLGQYGSYWVSTIHSGHPEDELDASGVVVASGTPGRVFTSQAVSIDSDHPWTRRFNLLETATVFFDVRERGSYQLTSTGVKATHRLEPFLVDRPPNYKAPAMVSPGKSWDLDPGLWVLTIEPTERGVAELTLARTGFFGTSRPASPGVARLPRGGLRFPKLELGGQGYSLHLNQQPGVVAGMIIRSLPVDLRDPLFVTQAPGEEVVVPFRATEPGELTAQAEDGARLELSVDGGAWTKSAQVTAGDHRVSVRHAGAHLALYSLGLQVTRLSPSAPLPPLPDARLAALPAFPVLSDREPLFLDLDRSSSASFLVRASAPALHRLETTGLLATEGHLRTRVSPRIASAAEDGVGRNFLIQRYLGQGDHQLTITTRGRTRGHLGVSLTTSPVADGGRLEPGVPARATLPSGTAIVYPFEIREAGAHTLRAIGVGRTLTARLEDEHGWPLMTPGGKAQITRRFDAGRYRLVVLPEPLDLRVVTLLERAKEAPTFSGKGPHALPLDTAVSHVFVEAKVGEKSNTEARRPDVWELTLPASVEVDVEVSGKLQGDLILVREDGTREKAGYVPPLRSFSGHLAKGKYRLEVMPLGESSGVPYTVRVRPRALVSGLERRYDAPTRIPLSIGDESLVELSSFGTDDVRARLRDASGATIAMNDDRPDDWNFHVAERLAPGDYVLELSPVATSRAATIVRLKRRAEVVRAAITVPGRARIAAGEDQSIHPLTLPAGAGLVVVEARSPETLGLVLELEDRGRWRAVASAVGRPARVEVALDSGTGVPKARIRVWSADERGLPVDVVTAAISPSKVGESALARGTSAKVISRDLAIAAIEATLDAPATLTLDAGDDDGVRWIPSVMLESRPLVHGKLSTQDQRVWLVRDVPTGQSSTTIRARRARVEPKRPMQLELAPGRAVRVDAASTKGGPILVEARTKRARAGLTFLDASGARSLGAMDVARGAAITMNLAPDEQGTALSLWSADDTLDAFDVTLSASSLVAEKPGALAWGTTAASLAAGAARTFTLPSGTKRVRVALERGMVAALSEGARITRLHVAEGEEETFESSEGTLTLGNPLGREARWSIELVPSTAPIAAARVLGVEAPYEVLHPRAGALRLDVAPSPGRATLRVRGAGASATWVGRTGRITSGTDLALDGEGGTLHLSHGTGLLLAWLESSGRDGLFESTQPSAAAVELP